MKLTTSILVAALATLSSAATTALPAKFTLSYTTSSGNVELQKYQGPVTIDSYFGAILNLGPGGGQVQVPLQVLADKGVLTVPEEKSHLTRTLVVQADGTTQFWWDSPGPSVGASSGFAQTNGLLSLDLKDGKGPQSLWKACTYLEQKSHWEVQWGAAGGKKDCVAVDLHVVAV